MELDLREIGREIDRCPQGDWSTGDPTPVGRFTYIPVYEVDDDESEPVEVLSVFADGDVYLSDSCSNDELMQFLPILEIVKRHREGNDA